MNKGGSGVTGAGKSGICTIVAMALATAGMPQDARAASWTFVPPEARSTAAPVAVTLVLAQDTLDGGEDPGAAPPPNYLLNGVLGKVLFDGITQARQSAANRKARAAVLPLVPALAGFDPNAVLGTAMTQALADTGWLRLGGTVKVSAAGTADRDAAAGMPDAPFTGLASCSYMLSGEFDSIYAACNLSLSQRGTDPGQTRLIHFRRVEVQVGLSHYAADSEGRKAQWLADSGAPLKQALTLALTRVARLSAKALAQTEADYDHYRDARKRNMGEYIDTHGGEMIEGAENLINSHESCFNRKNKSSVKPDSDGLLMQEEDGSTYLCIGLSPPA